MIDQEDGENQREMEEQDEQKEAGLSMRRSMEQEEQEVREEKQEENEGEKKALDQQKTLERDLHTKDSIKENIFQGNGASRTGRDEVLKVMLGSKNFKIFNLMVISTKIIQLIKFIKIGPRVGYAPSTEYQ